MTDVAVVACDVRELKPTSLKITYRRKETFNSADADSAEMFRRLAVVVPDPKQPSGCTPADVGKKGRNFPKEPPPPNSVKTKTTASIQTNKIRYITNSVSNNLFHMH